MIIKYVIGLVAGWFIGSIGIINILTILKFGLPMCNKLIKNESNLSEKAKRLKNTYIFSLIIWIVLSTIITVICYKFLENAFVGYIIAVLFMTLLGIGQTGENSNNISDFYTNLNNER